MNPYYHLLKVPAGAAAVTLHLLIIIALLLYRSTYELPLGELPGGDQDSPPIFFEDVQAAGQPPEGDSEQPEAAEESAPEKEGELAEPVEQPVTPSRAPHARSLAQARQRWVKQPTQTSTPQAPAKPLEPSRDQANNIAQAFNRFMRTSGSSSKQATRAGQATSNAGDPYSAVEEFNRSLYISKINKAMQRSAQGFKHDMYSRDAIYQHTMLILTLNRNGTVSSVRFDPPLKSAPLEQVIRSYISASIFPKVPSSCPEEPFVTNIGISVQIRPGFNTLYWHCT